MTSFGDTKLKNAGDYLVRNANLDNIAQGMGRVWHSYRAKYVTCRNARMTPFWHAVFFAAGLNYAIEYSHLKAHSRMRKYH